MKKFKLIPLILIFGSLSLGSCSKSSTNPQQGDVKITAHYNDRSDQDFIINLAGSPQIEIFQGGSSKGSQYADGNGVADFTNINYGSYTVKVTYSESIIQRNNGVRSGNQPGEKDQNFSVNSSPTYVTVQIN